jgi:hypothetical protein
MGALESCAHTERRTGRAGIDSRPGRGDPGQTLAPTSRVLHFPHNVTEPTMPKGEQRSNKLQKKPKKDTSPPKEGTSDRPMPPTTTVLPKGKLKNKL